MQGPLQTYRDAVAEGRLKDDSAQRHAVEKLQLLHNRLADYEPARPKRVGLGRFGWGRERIKQAPIPGLYLYGGVGRGKSMLMDLFFDASLINPKRRVHFHAFMQEVHAAIHAARAKGVEDPVALVADGIAKSATLLCFDEMQITDITDAMLVGRLFEKLFAAGVIVVTTSNRHPDDLYKDGLNRQLFLPFIELIKQRLEVYHLDSPTDHRQMRMAGSRVYHWPLGAEATAALDEAWETLAGAEPESLVLNVQGHDLVIPGFHNGIARADFTDLCGRALGPADFLELAENTHVVILDHIPQLSRAKNNEAKRFVTLIDALYEARVKLICSAAAEPERLYIEGAEAFEFERTASRLREMMSADWWGER